MKRFSPEFFDDVTTAVEQAEQKTSAELVVAIHPRSGSYRDADLLCGAAVAFTGLVFIVYNPWTVHSPVWFPLEVALLFVLSALACSACSWLRRQFSTASRRTEQVAHSARAIFVEENVSHTRERTGLLIYLSRLERQVVVLADLGVTAAVPPDDWGRAVQQLKAIPTAENADEAILQAIESLGDMLAKHLPPGEDNPDEIPNRPRSRE
jgi:putative membrane protein